MIDGDDIINIAVETGYRISVCDSATASKQWNNTFAVHKCPNSNANLNSNKKYICSQNGFIKIIDTEIEKEKEKENENGIYYQVQFRKFSAIIPERRPSGLSSESVSNPVPEARAVTQHWDKMALIPHRPGEVLFLIGVSKTLFYSAFPGECSVLAKSPLTAHVKRRNVGFSYGTPVVEIAHHNVRITTVEVTPKTGQFLATGDEDGFVKVMMLIRPKHLFHTIESRSIDNLNFQCKSLSDQQNGIRMHNGPIFSLIWIESMSTVQAAHNELKEYLGDDEEDEQRQYLVSGSADRCVKVWEVYWNQEGIVVTLLATLDTLSSHILSLSSTVLVNHDLPPNEDMARIFLKSPGRKTTPKKGADLDILSSRGRAMTPRVSHTQMVVASTNLGTIYVWRVHPYELKVHPDFTADVDSGKHLIAIIHSSDTPVVRAILTLTALPSSPNYLQSTTPTGPSTPNSRFSAMSTTGGTGPNTLHLVLCTADTSGTLCIHSAPYHVNSDVELTTLPDEMLSESDQEAKAMSKFCKGSRGCVSTPATPSTPSTRFREHTALMNNFAEQDVVDSEFAHVAGEDEDDLIMFSICGQAQFPNPVVHCEFETTHRPNPAGIVPYVKDVVTVDPKENPYKRREVVAVLNLDDAENSDPTSRRDKHGYVHVKVTVDTSDNDEFGDDPLKTCINVVFLNNDTKSVNTTELLKFQQKRQRDVDLLVERNTNNNANVATMKPLLDVEQYDDDSGSDDEPLPRREMPRPSPSSSSKNQSSTAAHSSTISRRPIDGSKNSNKNQRPKSLLKKSVSYDFDRTQKATVYEDDEISALDEEDIGHSDTVHYTSTESKSDTEALRVLKLKTRTTLSPPPPPPPPTSSGFPDAVPFTAPTVGNLEKETHHQAPCVQIPLTPLPGDKANQAPTSTVRFAEQVNTYANVAVDPAIETEKIFAKQDKMLKKFPQSEFSVPGVNSSKALLAHIKSQHDYEDETDNTSIETSSSDRRYLANNAVNHVPQSITFHDLPPLSDEVLLSRLPKKVELRPQIDRKWKQRQDMTVPPEEALKVFAMKDVEVFVEAKVPTYQTQPSKATKKDSSSGFVRTPLRVDGDPVDSMKKMFTIDIPLDEVYGSLHDTSIGRSEHYTEYLDEVMSDIDRMTDDLHCGW